MRVLSIQSHVVSGYVGNKAATFPLQVLGFDVDAVNSVQFSNHTGYSSWTGAKLDDDGLWKLFEGLERNDLAHYTHLLTGYIGSAAVLRTVARIARRLKEINPDLIYVCDPVMGDHGKLYVPQESVEVYKSELLSLATVVKPNFFEAELLTGLKVHDETSGKECLRALQAKFPSVSTAIISSIHTDTEVIVLGAHRQSATAATTTNFRLSFPRLDAPFTGTGDLFSALLLAWAVQHPDQPHVAVEKCIASIQAVLRRTIEHRGSSTRTQDCELQLIQSKADIENPSVVYRATLTTE
eukprot:m.66932 g.66932  ORF g.66932 m.66932 type:complete len:296 (-) comp14084_c0_seq3:226-1113(-)